MKVIIIGCLFILISTFSFSQTNNPISIYEGMLIESVGFNFLDTTTIDSSLLNAYKQVIKQEFRVVAQTQFNSFMASYYISKLNLLSFVQTAKLNITLTPQNSITLIVNIILHTVEQTEKREENIAKNLKLFPVLYNSNSTYITLKAAASQMAYSNNNSWFAQPIQMTTGNPLAEAPSGRGYTGWVEGFGSIGLYGIIKIIPAINMHIYGGANYLVSFSAGRELFTDKSRIYGNIEEAFVGIIGGGHNKQGKNYLYNASYGRKQFTLGDGWLIINTSMNGYNKAALQLNPRWAAKSILQGGFTLNWLSIQGFSLKPNELDILNSKTTINGINLQLKNKSNGILGLSFLQIPHSNFKYYIPNGTVQTRKGLQVYNIRAFKGAPKAGGLFFKAEGGYQRNPNFDMSAWAYYGELGWNFAKTKGSPTISYRYAYFSGDNPDSKSYNKWDALYTGGNGEQWVQGSNMYKIIQNSNEITHRLQCVYQPFKKTQIVVQLWLFYAAQKNNIGGNPALSTLNSKFYGSEYNLTLKYFYSRNWYFHLNTAYTIPGCAIKGVVTNTKNWFCLSFFARYSF
ncbi:MAG: alginate export family protein [Bacteroidales bacterium]